MSNAIHIDKLEIGSPVTLRLYHGGNSSLDTAIFLGVKGEGDDRLARFSSVKYQYRGVGALREIVSADTYTWEAYRYQGRWAWGSSAGRVSVVAVLDNNEQNAQVA